jgi:hypothetical protein
MQRVNNLQHSAGVHLAPVTGSAPSELLVKAVPLGDPLHIPTSPAVVELNLEYHIVIPVSGPRSIS